MIRLVLLFLLCTPLAYAESELSLGLGGLTIHGGPVDKDAASFMPTKIDSAGHAVVHPTEISLTHKNYYHYTQSNITVLKDCFGWWAVMAVTGVVVPLGKYDVGAVVGLYTRHKQVFERNGVHYIFEDYPSALFSYGNSEVVPMVFLTTGWKILPWLSFNVGSNWFITHAQLSVAL